MTLTMDSPKLRELTRIQLQSLAKREVVRAVGKTEDIIRRLMRKHPRGVPVPEDVDNPSASAAPPKRRVSPEGTVPVPDTPGARTGLEDEGEPAAETTPFSSSSSSEALKQLLYPEVDEPEAVAGPSNTNHESVSASHPAVAESEAPQDEPQLGPAPFPGEPSPNPPLEHSAHEAREGDGHTRSAAQPPEAPRPGWREEEEEEGEEEFAFDYPKGAPSHYNVVDALRQFTTLVNTIPTMKTRIAESRCLLKRAESLVEKATPDSRELTVTREYLEMFVLARLKQKRELWDGTGKMNKKDRKFRMEWLRAERKAANEKRWKEANELNKKHGLDPEPFSAFALESDEEAIESLQTTPASSRSGSCKRSREESVDVEPEADSDAGTDDESQRKRARS